MPKEIPDTIHTRLANEYIGIINKYGNFIVMVNAFLAIKVDYI